MVTRARVIANGKPGRELPEEPDLAAVASVLARLTARLIVHVSSRSAGTAATFRSIVTRELRIGTDADVDVIERWLTNHPGG